MKCIHLTITPLSPLAIGRKKPGSVSEAADFISGSVIRGAIAAQMLSSTEPNTDLSQNGGDFQSLFIDQKPAIFHNAYPAKKLLPTTAVSSKTKPGFRPGGNGVFDTLIDRFCAECYNHPYDPNCPIDGGRVEPFSGFYSEEKQEYPTASVSKSLLTRVGINRRRNTSEEEILYSLEVLNSSTEKKKPPKENKEKINVFYGSILVDNDSLAELLTTYINKKEFRLGGATSRGLGKVEIEADCQNWNSDLRSRFEIFNQILRQRWQTWSIFGTAETSLPENRCYFTINLEADAILTENWLHTTIISPSMLCQWAGVEDPSLNLHVAYSSYDYRSGWNSAWGLMKDVELITNKGGVYLFSSEQQSLWISALEKLEIQGVGDRTTEGFGKISISHPFHQIFRE